jgi:elongation factor 2
VFDHWEVITSDPLDTGSQSGKIVLDIRKRKGVREFVPPTSEYEDKL